MALDNAQFISELSITDPPGTDAVAEGDDHIRTVKRATQQSFPNVDAAVPQTAAQMGQMAIKNEVNTFTQANIFTSTNTFDQGLEANNSRIQANNVNFVSSHSGDRGYAYENDVSGETEWIMQSRGTSKNWRLRRFVAGVDTDSPMSCDFLTGAMTFTSVCTFVSTTDFQGKPTVTNGSLAIRQGTVGGVTDLQFQEIAAGNLQWIIRRSSDATGGNYQILRRDAGGGSVDTPFQIDFGTGEFLLANPIRQINGTAALPAYAFTSHANAGMYRSGTNRLGFTTAGLQRMDIGTTRIQLLQGVEMPGLPTSNPGGTGVLWKSGGFIAIT